MSAQRTIAVLSFLALLALVPAPAHAQWWPMHPGYPYPFFRFAGPESDLRFHVTPKDAEIYIDGYYAGVVDDYDGAFQRLHVAPGEHEIVVYRDGYRSLRQQLYLSPNRTRKIEGDLERLGPDDPPEPKPVPMEHPERLHEDEDGARALPPRPQRPRQPPVRRPLPVPQPDPTASSTASATLSIRIQPAGTTVLIDGEEFVGPANTNERLLVQVAEGRHTLEVRRRGYQTFSTEIDVRRGETEPINVSLQKGR